MNNIGPDCRLNLDLVATVPSELAKPRFLLAPDDILVCHTNSVKLVGKVAVFDMHDGTYVYSNHLTRLRVAPEIIDPKWLWHVLATLWRDGYFETRCKQWVNQAAIERQTLLDAPVPLPPLPEQRRIVARLEALLAESRAAREALAQVPAQMQRFRQAVLARAFRGELVPQDPADEPAGVLLERIRAERRQRWEKEQRTRGKDPGQQTYAESEPSMVTGQPAVPEGWVWTSLGSVFEVSLGGTPPRKKEAYWSGDIPWVSSGEVAFCHIGKTRERISAAGLTNSNAKLNPAGTVLLAMIGEGKTRGQAAILDVPAATNQNVASLLCSETPIPPEWVFWWLMAHYEETRGGGSGGAQPALNAARVKALPIPLAPLPEQRRIVARIEPLFAQAAALAEAVTAALQWLEQLDQAVLARVFRGEL